MNENNGTAYEALVKIQNKCDEICESCSYYDDEDGICKWEEAVGAPPYNWTLGKLRMNTKELEIVNVFEANHITRLNGTLNLRTSDGGSVSIIFNDGSILFDWLKEGESADI